MVDLLAIPQRHIALVHLTNKDVYSNYKILGHLNKGLVSNFNKSFPNEFQDVKFVIFLFS